MQGYPLLPFPDSQIQPVTPPLHVAKNLEQIKRNLCSFKTELSFAAQCPASLQRGSPLPPFHSLKSAATCQGGQSRFPAEAICVLTISLHRCCSLALLLPHTRPGVTSQVEDITHLREFSWRRGSNSVCKSQFPGHWRLKIAAYSGCSASQKTEFAACERPGSWMRDSQGGCALWCGSCDSGGWWLELVRMWRVPLYFHGFVRCSTKFCFRVWKRLVNRGKKKEQTKLKEIVTDVH